jgi:DNA-binding transcriptional LysR family regulator
MSDVTEALNEVRGLRNEPSGRLRINAPPPAIDLVLAPMIGPFLKANPKVELEVVGQSGFIDIVGAGFDAGVRYNEHFEKDMIATPLGPPQRDALVAAPDYLARHDMPRHPRDLLERDCIRIRFSSGGLLDWEFEKAGRAVKLSPPPSWW